MRASGLRRMLRQILLLGHAVCGWTLLQPQMKGYYVLLLSRRRPLSCIVWNGHGHRNALPLLFFLNHGSGMICLKLRLVGRLRENEGLAWIEAGLPVHGFSTSLLLYMGEEAVARVLLAYIICC